MRAELRLSATAPQSNGWVAWQRPAAWRKSLVILCHLTLLFLAMSGAWAQPLAVNGALDLSAVDIAESGPLGLDGDWEFFPGRLFSPTELASPARSVAADYLSLPGAWTGFEKDGRELDGTGVATLRLRVVAPHHRSLALRVFDVRSAYRLWVNGEVVSARGIVGESAESERYEPSLDMAVLRDGDQTLDLVLQVSNHHYRDGGVIAPIMLGTEQAIWSGQTQRWALALFFVGGLLVMGCYHLFYWRFHRANPVPLYFGLYCLLWMGNYIASNASEWALLLFFPGASIDFMERFNALCFFVSLPIGYLFFSSMFPREFSKKLLRAIWMVFSVFVLLALAASMITLQSSMPYAYLLSVVLIVYCLLRLFRARRLRREGAIYLLVGFAILGLIAVNDMLNDLQLIRTVYLVPAGMFCFILAQGFALALSFSRAFSAVEALSTDLEQRNRALEEQEVERARLEHEIVNASENERRCLGLDLHDGLCQELTAARLRCTVLERKHEACGQGDAELAELSLLLDHSVNHAYDLVRGLWPLDLGQAGMGISFLEEFCSRLALSTGVIIRLRNFHSCAIFPPDDAIHLYRIAQEAINNAVRHAKASLIEVSLECATPAGELKLCVRDNGIGIGGEVKDRSPGGLGMRIMAHRARMIGGGLAVGTAAGGGVEVVCAIPCGRCARNGAAE